MKAIGVPLVLLVLFCLSFSVYSHHQNLLLSVYDFLVRSNSKLDRFAFFVVFNFIIVIISLGSTKTSEADFEGFFSQTSFLYESISNTTTIEIDDNGHRGYDGSDEDINSDDIGGEEDDDDDDENGTDNEHQGYDGSDEDNNEDINSDDIGSEEDDDENDTGNEMEKRAEEFIAKVKQRWREELLTDRLLCITSA